MIVYSIYPQLVIYEILGNNDMTLIAQIDTTLSFENIFANIAQSANMTIKNVKKTIQLHGQVIIFFIKNFYTIFTRYIFRRNFLRKNGAIRFSLI